MTTDKRDIDGQGEYRDAHDPLHQEPSLVQRLILWAGDRLFGPRCPYCTHRGSGTRSLNAHVRRQHQLPETEADGCHRAYHDLGVHAPDNNDQDLL